MVAAVFDTNILIDHLNGVEHARVELGRFASKQISIITWIEVLVGTTGDVEARTRMFLRQFDILLSDAAIAESAVQLRRAHRIRLPDALIWATADVHSLILVTRNTKDFPTDSPGIRVPYEM